VTELPETIPTVAADSQAAFWEILRLIGLCRRVSDPYFARFGISAAQWAVLRILRCAEKEGPDGLRLADLVNKLLVKPPSVTNVVERLRVSGLIVRECSTNDHRAKVVRLTDAGRELVERILKNHGKQIALMLAGLDAGEQQALKGLLGKLNTHLESIAPHEAAGESED
jgi:DNA-binding MarR family transcriptional regulator